ncbi:MAG: electron transport complex subunit RsxC [Gemmatimonadota bacterium]
MSAAPIALPGPLSFARGIHPPERKAFAADVAIEVVPAPKQVTIALLQHTGAPNEQVVKNREEVALGTVVGRSDAFVSAPVHASVAGKAGNASVATLPNGRHVAVVPLRAEGEQLEGQALFAEIYGGEWPHHGLDRYEGKQIIQAIREAGVVGLGGAAFPTHVKLSPPQGKSVDTLLVNGSECEPYLTADYRLMVEAPQPIITGALLAARAVGATSVVLGIEDNKPLAVTAMQQAANGTGVRVVAVKTKYPMGGERQLIPALLEREVPTGGLPLDVGVVVMNVGTAAAVARAVVRGKPLTHRIVTVSGAGIAQPKNLLVPVGITYGELVEFCGGLRPDAARIVVGGPMMGFTLGDLDVPVTKGTSGITVLTAAEVREQEKRACVRCGRCVDVCPLNLVPTKIAMASRHGDWGLARQYHMAACMECGCCAYICPSRIPLVQLIRMGKARAPRN